MEFYQLLLRIMTSCLQDYSAQSPMFYKQNMKILFYFFIQSCIKFERIEWKTEDTSKKSKLTQDNLTVTKKTLRFQSLQIIVNFLQLESSSLWTMSMIPENFLSPIWNYAFSILESRANGIHGTSNYDQEARQLCLLVLQICIDIGNENLLDQFATAMVNGICQYEHLANWMADLFAKSKNEFMANLMTEISHLSFNETKETSNEDESNNNQTPKLVTPAKHIGMFLVKWTELNPTMSGKYLPLVLHQFASDAHQIR